MPNAAFNVCGGGGALVCMHVYMKKTKPQREEINCSTYPGPPDTLTGNPTNQSGSTLLIWGEGCRKEAYQDLFWGQRYCSEQDRPSCVIHISFTPSYSKEMDIMQCPGVPQRAAAWGGGIEPFVFMWGMADVRKGIAWWLG